MIAILLEAAERDLVDAYDYYDAVRDGLGAELAEEFRKGIDRIIQNPNGWQALDNKYRRYRLHRFPYGIVYRIEGATDRAIVVAVTHFSRRPGLWRSRE